MEEQHLVQPLKDGELHLVICQVGKDISAVLYGGEKPHIGCAVLAVPRPSLADEDAFSCTSSVLNLTGHKDEAICRTVAETLCKQLNTVVCCTGGFHRDNISAEGIREVEDAVLQLLKNFSETNGFSS